MSSSIPQSVMDLPLLPDGWAWTVLNSLVDKSRGICYGIVQPGSHTVDGVPMVNTGDVFDGHVNKLVNFNVAQSLHQKFKRSTLRDTLLPRLISGLLRLPDAEAIVGEV